MVRILSSTLFKQIMGISSLLFMLVTLFGCDQKSNSELLIGKWKLKSITDLEKKTTRNFQSDQMIFLKITKDSIFQYENTFKDHPEKSGWKISNDTIHLTSRGYTFLDYRILEINDELLKVQSTIHLMSSHSKKTLIKSNKIELFERLN